MADLRLSKAQQKWLPWVERNLVYDKSKAWRFYKEDICGIRPGDVDKPLSRRRANKKVIVGMLPDDPDDMAYKTLKQTIMKRFGLRQGKDEAVRDGGTSNTVFRGVRLMNKTGYEWIDNMWVGSTDAFKIWARGKWRDDCLEEEADLRRSWSAGSLSKMAEMEAYR